jgi:sugar/nucleoside kinase (ribokinase family)
MIDVAIATTPFLDMTFTGLGAIPRPGEERYATGLHRSPGGGAITAVGAARLGLSTALAGPLGADEHGAALRIALEAEGIRLVPPHPGRTATTVVMPTNGERAMVTYDEGVRPRRADLEALEARVVVCGLGDVGLVPNGSLICLSCGDEDARAHAGDPPEDFAKAHVVLTNESEAAMLTGEDDPAGAARRLAALGTDAIVTRGPAGAVAVIAGTPLAVPGADVGTPVDTTGAGDLFAAAYIWADLRGAPPEDRLRWAVLYAAMSVTVPTAVAGASTASRLVQEGSRHGLAEPHYAMEPEE